MYYALNEVGGRTLQRSSWEDPTTQLIGFRAVVLIISLVDPSFDQNLISIKTLTRY